jgi:hypothetical protein
MARGSRRSAHHGGDRPSDSGAGTISIRTGRYGIVDHDSSNAPKWSVRLRWPLARHHAAKPGRRPTTAWRLRSRAHRHRCCLLAPAPLPHVSRGQEGRPPRSAGSREPEAVFAASRIRDTRWPACYGTLRRRSSAPANEGRSSADGCSSQARVNGSPPSGRPGGAPPTCRPDGNRVRQSSRRPAGSTSMVT